MHSMTTRACKSTSWSSLATKLWKVEARERHEGFTGVCACADGGVKTLDHPCEAPEVHVMPLFFWRLEHFHEINRHFQP